ncbi:MAG: Ribosomal RNA small subunit methyltransferase H [Chlamydiia bacterium]|nr:Ribosomal RNA small subunit methyltransferase H [Chlamydiia bacterium]
MQLDQEKRGFSFSKEGPLDMRMDTTQDLTAKKVVNSWPEKKLATLFRDFGEEPKFKQAAQAIVSARKQKPIESTKELAEILTKALGARPRKRLHPATLIFQALRICVNRELESVQTGIQKALEFLSPNGILGAISFHSLEDRIVKNILRDAARPIKKFKDEHKKRYMTLLTKKPLVCSKKEFKENRRARSAKMRFAQKN